MMKNQRFVRALTKTLGRVSIAAVILFGAGSAMAQQGFGVRAGASADPGQFHFGVHYATDPLIGALHFRPNLEIGVGGEVTTVAANFEFAYRIPFPKTDLSAYVGAGPALNISRFDSQRGRDTDAGGGFNVLLGLEHNEGLFGEIKIGALDSPEFKVTVGYTF